MILYNKQEIHLVSPVCYIVGGEDLFIAKTIYNKTSELESIIGHQKVQKDKDYRFIYLCKIIRQDDTILIFNMLTSHLIKIDKDLFQILNEGHYCTDYDFYITNWFLVPIDFDEFKLLTQIENIKAVINNKGKFFNQYTILTTTSCNANCYYCFERKNNITMNGHIAHDCAKFIVSNCDKKKSVSIRWFGGEPLCNKSAINIICNDLKKNDIKYVSSIVSNCSLFSKNDIEIAKQNWNLKRVQVTIDGTEKIYNKTKAYKGYSANPFESVLNNIKMLLQNEIQVICRINFDCNYEKDMYALVDKLLVDFGITSLFKIQAHLIYKYNNDKRIPTNEDELEKFLDFQKYVYSKNVLLVIDPKDIMRQYHCMADNPNAVVILPNGKLGKCDYYVDSDTFGDIYNSKYDYDLINKYNEFNKDSKCNNCKFRPICSKLDKCPNTVSSCYENRILLEKKIEYWMLTKYKDYVEYEKNYDNTVLK